jgi:rSAM/selenodomain-associated transferase 1
LTPYTDARRDRIVVFAKAPRPGAVKTRMCPPLTHEQAARLYSAMLDDVLEETLQATRSLGLEGVVALHPADACREMAGRVPASFRVMAQRGPDLESRMAWAVADALAAGASRVLLRGSDNPALTRERIAEALGSLDAADVVLCPDLDGGYGLVGLRGPAPGLFEHPMSTDSVLSDTRANARALGLSTHLTSASFDLDTAADFEHLASARARLRPETCPRTLDFLDRNGLWSSADRALF